MNIEHNICKDCKKCCNGELSGSKPCKGLTSTGCMLSWGDRNVICKYYPIIIMIDPRFVQTKRIYVDTACPHWRLFGDMAESIKDDDIGDCGRLI